MSIADIVMVLAVLVAPFFAVYAQKKIERWRAAEDMKLWIFKSLMATRTATLSGDHVRALNMIDLEFSDKRKDEKEVKRIWREYLDNLGALPQAPEAQRAALPAWQARNADYLADLLVAMGKCFGYNFDRVFIKKGIYAPEGHAKDEAEQRTIRLLLLQLLRGESSITTKTSLVPFDVQAAAFAERFQTNLLNIVEGRQPIAIASRDNAAPAQVHQPNANLEQPRA